MKKNKAGKEIKEYKEEVKASLRKCHLSKDLNEATEQGIQLPRRTFQAKEEQVL